LQPRYGHQHCRLAGTVGTFNLNDVALRCGEGEVSKKLTLISFTAELINLEHRTPA
jgi:hypothetical protein